LDVLGDRIDGLRVTFLHGHVQQVAGVSEPAFKLIDGIYHGLQLRPLATKRLGAILIVPDLGIFEFAQDLDQAVLLLGIVKDTPSATERAP
jgi:hypothetical protein